MIPIHLAVEDLLSEQIVRRLLDNSSRHFHVSSVITRGGFGYLKSKIAAINKSAKVLPFFVLTDLDNNQCPSGLIDQWLSAPRSPNLVFRVAVREVEAWILGDRYNLSNFLGVSIDNLPLTPESLLDPKGTILLLAAKSRKADIRRRLLARSNRTAMQGREYNSCLTEFVASAWNPSAAAEICPSLAKCLRRIEEFQSV